MDTFLKSKKNIFFILLVLFAVSSLLRFSTYNYQSADTYHADVKRDYIVGHQMLTYKEIPLTGPNGHLGSGVNSPFYYYIIATLMFFFGGSILAIQIPHLLLQCISVVIVFLCVRNFFGVRAAFFTALFFASFKIFVDQAAFIWQPHLMQVIFLLSLWCFSQFYVLKKNLYLYLSILFFCCATVVHNSLFALIPVYMLGVFVILYARKQPLLFYARSFLLMFLCELFLFLPVMYFFLTSHPSNLGIQRFTNTVDVSIGAISLGLMRFNGFMQNSFFVHPIEKYAFLICILLSVVSATYLIRSRSIAERVIFSLFAVSLFSMIYVAGTVTNLVQYDSEFPSRYFTPILIPIIVLLGVLLAYVSRIKYVGIYLSGFAIAFLVTFGGAFETFATRVQYQPLSNPIGYFFPKDFFVYKPHPSAESVQKYVDKNLLSNNFTVNTVYWAGKSYVFDYAQDLLWEPLIAASVDRKYLSLDDATIKGYRPNGTEPFEYVILKCWYINESVCTKLATEHYKEYVLLESIYSSPEEGNIVVLKLDDPV